MAAHWFQLAGAKGHAQAQYKLGKIKDTVTADIPIEEKRLFGISKLLSKVTPKHS